MFKGPTPFLNKYTVCFKAFFYLNGVFINSHWPTELYLIVLKTLLSKLITQLWYSFITLCVISNLSRKSTNSCTWNQEVHSVFILNESCMIKILFWFFHSSISPNHFLCSPFFTLENSLSGIQDIASRNMLWGQNVQTIINVIPG